MKEIYELEISYSPNSGYSIVLDEGAEDFLSLEIDKKDNFKIDYGNVTYFDFEKNKRRRIEVIYKKFFKKIMPNLNIEVLFNDTGYIEGLFFKTEQFIIDNDILVTELDDSFQDEWNYTTFTKEKTKTISYYLYEQDVAIFINGDDSFFVYETIDSQTKNKDGSIIPIELTKEQKLTKRRIIEKFIFDILGIKIKCLNDVSKKTGLFNKAIKHTRSILNEDSKKYADDQVFINKVSNK